MKPSNRHITNMSIYFIHIQLVGMHGIFPFQNKPVNCHRLAGRRKITWPMEWKTRNKVEKKTLCIVSIVLGRELLFS